MMQCLTDIESNAIYRCFVTYSFNNDKALYRVNCHLFDV